MSTLDYNQLREDFKKKDKQIQVSDSKERLRKALLRKRKERLRHQALTNGESKKL